ncbi:MAG: hypothetical protein IJC68_04620, partial [Firmicutes bacterium]|nr:hypothetical protein [Bacillota bacterium]
MEDVVRLYEAVFYRKSVRQYKPEPLPMDELFALQQETKELEALLPEIPYAIEVVSQEKVKGLFTVKAPHYLCFYSKEGVEGMEENAGYIMEQMALILAARGLGACWLGAAKPPKPMKKSADGLDFVIMMAFGYPDEEPVRKDPKEFRRKPISEVTDVAECSELLEAVRLAPSAVNSQPWLVTGREGELLFSRIKPNLLKNPFMGPLNRIDMGIALLHFRVAAAFSGKAIRISMDPQQKTSAQPVHVPAGCLFSA